jgi:hypothetical protein
MKITPLFHSILAIGMLTILFTSCKKNELVEVEPEPEQKDRYLPDSIYFEIEGKNYSSKSTYSSFVLNSGPDLKYLNAPKPGMKQWAGGIEQGPGYYSPVDSIYYGYGTAFESPIGRGYRVAFYKGFHTRNLKNIGAMWYPQDMRKMLAKGKLGFATDAENRNSLDGVSIILSGFGTTGLPDTHLQASIEKYSQDDSYFEITKTEQVSEDLYRIEARFEVNVYQEDSKLRVTKGYLLLNIPRERYRGLPYY